MLKKMIVVPLFLLAACSSGNRELRYCPNVQVTPDYNHVTKMYGNEVWYTVEIVGYEGYCRYDEKKGSTNAHISPVFEIVRYYDRGGKNIEFAYYVNTEYNQNKLMGRQPHSFKASLAVPNKKYVLTGKEITVQIPNGEPGYQINLELALTKRQYQYNQIQGLQFKGVTDDRL